MFITCCFVFFPNNFSPRWLAARTPILLRQVGQLCNVSKYQCSNRSTLFRSLVLHFSPIYSQLIFYIFSSWKADEWLTIPVKKQRKPEWTFLDAHVSVYSQFEMVKLTNFPLLVYTFSPHKHELQFDAPNALWLPWRTLADRKHRPVM